MTTIAMQRDLVVSLKKETSLNVGILSKLHPMPVDLSRQIFKDNALDKPTQSFFNHLSYYLVCIIDFKASGSLPWPLYDTKTEKMYRNELSSFINHYSSKGLLSPVMTSYLVNPGCYKVTMLMFQMSQLAVQRTLLAKMNKKQKYMYDDMTERYKHNKEGFMDTIDVETKIMMSKFSNYLYKRNMMEKIAEIFRNKITDMEAKLASLNAQKYIDDLVDGYINTHTVHESLKTEILRIKNIGCDSKFFDMWLADVDEQTRKLETEWNKRITPFLDTSVRTKENTEALIARHTGEAEKSSYMIEYNPNSDFICTEDLQNQVNSEQKYILKNIIKDNRLNFPNLIRGFLISICFILKNTEIGDEIYKFNEYLEGGKQNFAEILSAMKVLVDRVYTAEARLQPSPLLSLHVNESISMKEISEIPPLPDLSDLKASREHSQMLFDTFTPFSISKHQFNLHRRHMSLKHPKSVRNTPFFQPPRDDFLKSLISCRVSYDRNTSNIHNISDISSIPSKPNETIAECSGFTKQQILRLLSTKKSTSSKKFKYKTERPSIHIKKGGLFHESNESFSNGLYRSHSSPNLFENIKSNTKLAKRKLSIMEEDIHVLEVSGITMLEKDVCFLTPEAKTDNCTNVDAPLITVTKESELKINNLLRDIELDLNKEIKEKLEERSLEVTKEDSKVETPKMNGSAQLVKKTNSLEKIINRFKKVRAQQAQPETSKDEFKTIVEEKENYNSVNVDVFMANRVLLPDLLSPSCSALSMKTDYLDQICSDMDENVKRKPRESLGTALGVDQTFLDQFDLVD